MISLVDVDKVYRSSSEAVWAVRQATLEVKPGEYVALMGPSGCGKSTLINLIAGLDQPNRGTIEVDGRLVSRSSEAVRARLRLTTTGTVFQDHNLVPELTAIENVELPARLVGTDARSARASAEASLERVGLGDQAGRYPHQLSGGQRQRVGIARAVVGDRKVLLADEATGALDTTNSRAVFELLGNLAMEGYTVVCATHDLAVSEFATRLVTMSDGALTERQASELATWRG